MTDPQNTILYLTSNDARIEAMIKAVSQQSASMVFATTAVEGVALLERDQFAAIIVEDNLEDSEQSAALVAKMVARISQHQPLLRTFVIDSSASGKTQVAVTKALKPFPNIAVLVADFSRISTLNFELL